MNKENAIDVMNALIVINNDRIEGYETASKETKDTALQAMFARFRATSQKCRTELVTEVQKLGGTPDEGTRTTGKFFRVWMDVKSALTGHDRTAILGSCEYGEKAAQDAYEKALSDNLEDINADQQKMLVTHRMSLKADHDSITSMRESLLEHA
jgi:uncharacterized protein (TIGR02284 family)